LGKILRPSFPKKYPLVMQEMSGPRLHGFAEAWRRVLVLGLLALVVAAVTGSGQTVAEKTSPLDPLPQDSGVAGLRQMLLRLSTTARLMHTTAHPDDEDGGMLTLESRGKGVNALLLTLNRGEGGQNRMGSNLFDVLGVLRTLELLRADQYYGVEQRFTRVADFGFSKNPDETFQQWGGHDVALADMVRVIRTFRPDVLVSRFGGTERDGHGHHQASGILSREAFRAAADPKRFPEQIAEGLLPWQPKKFYTDNVCPFRSNECAPENYTVKLSTGDNDPALGMTYIQFAMEGLRHQLSQGAGGWSVDAGPHYAFYKLVDSVLPATTDSTGHEPGFFRGIDTSLPGLAGRLGPDESAVPFLRSELKTIAQQVSDATDAADGKDSSRAASPLFEISRGLDQLIEKVEKSDLSHDSKVELLSRLREKQDEAARALDLALNLSLEASVAPSSGASSGLPHEQEALTAMSPGQKFTVVVKLHNGSKYPLWVDDVVLDAPTTWTARAYKGEYGPMKPGEDYYANFQLQVPAAAAYTRPYWHRTNPETDSVNTVDDERYATLPLAPPLLQAHAQYHIEERPSKLSRFKPDRVGPVGLGSSRENVGPRGRLSAEVVVPFLSDKGITEKRLPAAVPAFSVELEPGAQVIPTTNGKHSTVKVGVSSNAAGAARGTLRLQLPEGWRAEPAEEEVAFARRGEKHDFEFNVFPAALKEGRTEVRAVLESGGINYSQGYSLVTREDLGAFYYYQPAVQRVSIVDVKVLLDLKVGYVMGAGDEIPTVLKQLGLDVTLIPPEKLANEELNRYGTIVLGIRAYDSQKDVAAHNKRLLDFVSAGGTLMVQYDTGVADFNSGHFTPYAARLSRARVSVEQSPVEILAPGDRVFHFPNEITPRDFDGWVQERGLYFMDQWDSAFKPLLASRDPGEEAQEGGLLKAQFGKGTYIYNAYAFFRQLPAGVPGAVRLYVNLLSVGHEKNER
jgi:LmbE family N-acetylglucosaminyl deacetylase